MVTFAGVLSLALLSVAACGGSSESPTARPTTTLAACPPGTVTFVAGSDGPHGVTPVLPDDDEALAAAVANSFYSPEWTFVEPDGTERTVTARAEAESIVDVFEECSDRWKLLLILSVTEGADKISDNSAVCVGDRLTDDEAKLMLIGRANGIRGTPRCRESPTPRDAR